MPVMGVPTSSVVWAKTATDRSAVLLLSSDSVITPFASTTMLSASVPTPNGPARNVTSEVAPGAIGATVCVPVSPRNEVFLFDLLSG